MEKPKVGKPTEVAPPAAVIQPGEVVVGQFTLEVLPDGIFRWRFKNILPIPLLGMLNIARDEIVKKFLAGEFAPSMKK